MSNQPKPLWSLVDYCAQKESEYAKQYELEGYSGNEHGQTIYAVRRDAYKDIGDKLDALLKEHKDWLKSECDGVVWKRICETILGVSPEDK